VFALKLALNEFFREKPGKFYATCYWAKIWVNFVFGRFYGSENRETGVLFELNQRAMLCVSSGEFMVFLTLTLSTSVERATRRTLVARKPSGSASPATDARKARKEPLFVDEEKADNPELAPQSALPEDP
jgi:hypothetical protein